MMSFALPVVCEGDCGHDELVRRRRSEGGSQMRSVNAVYYATLFALAAGLTAVLGYEVGWLAARSQASLVIAVILVPWTVFVAWAVSDV
jgi:hypothetical protein